MSKSVYAVYRHVFRLWRERRFQMFLRRIRPKPSDSLIDVGGNPWFWSDHPRPVERIDVVNLYPMASTSGVRALVGDGCALPMADGSYDIGFSNSVIEHVGGWERQQRFAAEIRRVARRLWVQTPAYECPLEPHYMAPCIHYLPPSVQRHAIRWLTPRGLIERLSPQQVAEAIATTRLLRRAEMCALFPDCEIITERMLGMIPKSYIAVRTEA